MTSTTYDLLGSSTLGTSASGVTFGSLPASGYGDLVLVVEGLSTSTSNLRVKFNNDSGSNYNAIRMEGNGSSGSSAYFEDNAGGLVSGATFVSSSRGLIILTVFNYLSGDTNTGYLVRYNHADKAGALRGEWEVSSPVNQVDFYTTGSDFAATTTFNLYGVAK